MGETRVIIINLLNKFYYVNYYTISQIQTKELVSTRFMCDKQI